MVYHISDSNNAMMALRNAQNHLSASSDVHIVVVSNGIDFPLNDAQDGNGNPYEPLVQTLKAKGVDFRVCNNAQKPQAGCQRGDPRSYHRAVRGR